MPSTLLSSEVLAIGNKLEIIGERMFDKSRVHFMNAYYKETEKPFGYLLVDNRPDTPADKQILGDLFSECYVYHFSVNSTEPTCVETKPAGLKRRDYVCHLGKKVNSTKFAKRDHSPGRKQPTHSNWSEASIPKWQKYTLGAQAVRKISEGYVIIEMYTTSRNGVNPRRPVVDINGERYWPVKVKHKSAGRSKWVNLHEDEPTVRAFCQRSHRKRSKAKSLKN